MSDEDLTFRNERVIAARPAEILAAFGDPDRLALWWGPAGFRNTFHAFEFRPGGEWIFTMHGPDERAYQNHCRFESIEPHRVEIHHLGSYHPFRLVIGLEAQDTGTRLAWCQTFENAEEYERVKPYVPQCNEENLDRLEAELRP